MKTNRVVSHNGTKYEVVELFAVKAGRGYTAFLKRPKGKMFYTAFLEFSGEVVWVSRIGLESPTWA